MPFMTGRLIGGQDSGNDRPQETISNVFLKNRESLELECLYTRDALACLSKVVAPFDVVIRIV